MLGEWMNRWLETYKKTNVTKGTYDNYLVINKIIQGHKISLMKLSDIRSIHIADFINDKQDYGTSALKKVKFMLSGAFEDAIDNDLCLHNPARKIRLPKKDKSEYKLFYKQEFAKGS